MQLLKIAIYSGSVAILCITSIVIAFGFIVLNHSSRKLDTSDAQRFNTNRQPLPNNALEAQIFPQQVGNYMLQPPNGVSPNTDSSGYFWRDYKLFGGGTISLYVRSLEKNFSQTSLLSSGAECGDAMGTIQLFPKAIMPYGYTFCDLWTYSQHRFNWINGNWFLRASAASTLQSDANMLIEFVHLYSY